MKDNSQYDIIIEENEMIIIENMNLNELINDIEDVCELIDSLNIEDNDIYFD